MLAFFICLFVLNALMFVSVIMFESSSKKIIFWGVMIAVASVFAYLPYILFFSDKWYIKKDLATKEHEDKIYKDLVEHKVDDKTSSCDLINFAKASYNTNFYKNTSLEILSSLEEFNNSVLSDIERAEEFVIVDTQIFMNSLNKDVVTQTLIDKANMGVKVKVVYTKKSVKDKAFLKDLKSNHIRVCKINKHNNMNTYYHNNKNIISIDGKVCYLYSTSKEKRKANITYFDLFYKFGGDLIKTIDLEAHQDTTYATNKFFEVNKYNFDNIQSGEYQYLTSSINNNFIDLILKAIISAKSSIILHFDKFIPHDSVLEAIKLAMKSGVDVQIMISKVNKQFGYYTSRSYVKELASVGASCYFYDGHINSNYAIFDRETVIAGTFSMVNQNLMFDVQDATIISDKKVVGKFVGYFDDSIKNSYKLNNSKRVLFRERFFRKFM